MASTIITNKSIEPCALPYPFRGILKGGQEIKFNVAIATVRAALGANDALELDEVPDGGPYDTFYQGDLTSGFSGANLTAGSVPVAALAASAFDVASLTSKFGAGAKLVRSMGVCGFGRLRVANAGGGGAAIAAGNTVTVGTVIFEFRNSSPPAGGTAGRIWVNQGANAAASKVNLQDAMNGVLRVADITYNGVTPPAVLAANGTVAATDIDVCTADHAGGTPVASAAVVATTETLADAADIWDDTQLRSGLAEAVVASAQASHVVTAAEIVKGNVKIALPFVPTTALLVNRTRQNVEAYVIAGQNVVLTTAGGGAPNTTAADVIDVYARG